MYRELMRPRRQLKTKRLFVVAFYLGHRFVPGISFLCTWGTKWMGTRFELKTFCKQIFCCHVKRNNIKKKKKKNNSRLYELLPIFFSLPTVVVAVVVARCTHTTIVDSLVAALLCIQDITMMISVDVVLPGSRDMMMMCVFSTSLFPSTLNSSRAPDTTTFFRLIKQHNTTREQTVFCLIECCVAKSFHCDGVTAPHSNFFYIKRVQY